MHSTVPLIEVVYISAATVPFTPGALRDLLARARANNRRLGVTGMLLYADGSFLQVLEGEAPTVDALYDVIGRDTRHGRVLRVFRTDITARSYGDWTMGFVEPDAGQRSMLSGFNHFLDVAGGGALDRSVAAKVRELAQQFRLGRWRQHARADGGEFGSSRARLT